MTTPTKSRLGTVRNALASPAVYVVFQRAVWGRAMRALVTDHIRAEPGQRLLDMGCGPADILRLMPTVDYVGFDHDEPYITAARRRFGDRGEFRLAAVDSVPPFEPGAYDIVLAKGLLHHISDAECRRLFDLAHSALVPGGRLITVDGCFHDRQKRAHRKITSMDRGEFIRTPEEYERLAGARFPHTKVTTHDDLLRIPYSLAIGEFTR